MDLAPLYPDARLLAAGVVLDLLLGDPVYRAHPVRLMGGALTWFENRLRAAGFDGYGGGISLFLLLASTWLAATGAVLIGAFRWKPWLGGRPTDPRFPVALRAIRRLHVDFDVELQAQGTYNLMLNLWFVRELPRSDRGKILRRELGK